MVVDQVLASCAQLAARERELGGQRGELASEIGRRVAQARACGVSWRRIAELIGLPMSTLFDWARPYLDGSSTGEPEPSLVSSL